MRVADAPLIAPYALLEKNVKFRESIVPRTGDTQFFLYDPDGVGVELNFPKP
jgi:hypothetical protein